MKKFKVLIAVSVCTLLLSSFGVMAAEIWKVSVSTQRFIVNGKSVKANSLNINDSNYLKVSEIAELLDIDISFDESTNTVSLDKSKPYTGVNTTTNLTNIENDAKIEKTYENGISNNDTFIADNDSIYNVKKGDKLTFTLNHIDNGVMKDSMIQSSNDLAIEISFINPKGEVESKGSINPLNPKIEFTSKNTGQYQVKIKNLQNQMVNIKVSVKKTNGN